MDNQNNSTPSGWSLRELSSKAKGDLVEMALGLGFIFSKATWAELTGIPTLVNAIEDALQSARPTEEQMEAKETENRKIHDEKITESQKEYEVNLKRNVIVEMKR
eukprot:12374670-Heterocapsa_arctica.AAC.1